MDTQRDIHDRIFSFVVRGLKVIRELPKASPETVVIVSQYLRSLTSIGANDTEADGVSSRKDFIHIYTIVRKELKETKYWLRIIVEVYPSLKLRLSDLLQENEELIRIVSAIISKTIKHIKS